MKKVIFEVATIADAVTKAYRVAPNKGREFELAQGIILDIDPLRFGEQSVVMSTDLAVTFRHVVTPLEIGDEQVKWRINAKLFNGIVTTLPTGSGSNVLIAENGDGYLYFICGKSKARLRLIEGDYPFWQPFDPKDLGTVYNFARRLQQVAWCTADGSVPSALAGVHMDGERLIATNGQAMVMVPCKIPLVKPITAPLNEISAIIKNTSEVALHADDLKVYFMPDSYTQATSVIIELKYPNVNDTVNRFVFDKSFVINVEAFQKALDRMLVLSQHERVPVTTLEIGCGTLKLEMEVSEVGKIADEIDIIGGQPDGEAPIRILFTPQLLLNSISNACIPSILIEYKDSMYPIKITNGDEYTCLVMAREK